jgi:DHA2 family multidrug resistance protein-like MFS transporter
VIGTGLGVGALGLAVLTQVGVSNGLAPLIVASVIISLGMAPVFGLTTELIVGSAPPERAGAASGISETGSELGGALGIAILGSIGVAIYRGELPSRLPAGVPPDAVTAARDTLGAAVEAAGALPAQLGDALRQGAQEAFVHGMQLTSAVATVVAIGLAIVTVLALKHVPPGSTPESGADAATDAPADSEDTLVGAVGRSTPAEA